MSQHFCRSLLAATLILLGACASAPPAAAREAAMLRADSVYPGARRFAFTEWPGAAIDVWLYRPAEAGADAPVLFVMHGVQRDADRYLREWAPVARAYGAVLVVPEFSRANFPGSAGYNLGNTFADNGAPIDRARWSYSAIEPIFDAVVAREGLTATRYLLFGHSAGAQFVHRFVMLGAGARLQRAVSANAGWYTYPDQATAWPYGLREGPSGPQPAAMFGAPLYLVLGDQDIDPNHRSLSREPAAMAVGGDCTTMPSLVEQ
jgi:poly(3-hydroxybutyrate) depolymerase